MCNSWPHGGCPPTDETSALTSRAPNEDSGKPPYSVDISFTDLFILGPCWPRVASPKLFSNRSEDQSQQEQRRVYSRRRVASVNSIIAVGAHGQLSAIEISCATATSVVQAAFYTARNAPPKSAADQERLDADSAKKKRT